MNALVKKEIRLLLPSFGMALALALSVWLIPTETGQATSRWLWLMILPWLLCPALVVMTALDSFGREISSNTFADLLAQSVSRERVWWTKSALLAVALLSVLVVWSLSLLLRAPWQTITKPEDLHEMFTTAVLLVVTVYSGGLCSVLLFRQVGAAFWFTLLVPAALAMLTVWLTEKAGQEIHTERNLIIVLVVYSIAGFLWARRLFLRAQDVQWTGGVIALPAWVRLPRLFKPSVQIAGRRPRLALVVKELQLHQSQFIIAGVLVLAHLGIIAARKLGDGFKESVALEFVAFQFWTLWVVMPLLIGCAALAEERKLGTLEAQLCLPVRRRTQFFIKLGVSLALAIFFGIVMPLLFEGSRILPDLGAPLKNARNANNDLWAYGTVAGLDVEILTVFGPVVPFLPLGLIAVSFVGIAFYASSLSRNTLQAIAPAIMGVLIAWALLVGARFIEDIVGYPLWRGWLIYLIGVPVLLVALAGLTYWNYKRVLVGWPVWRRNLAVFISALALVTTATTAIYQRAWELWQKPEPVHGPARLTAADVISMKSHGIRTYVLLADGLSWAGQLDIPRGDRFDALLNNWKLRLLPGGGFLAGSNWSGVAYCARDVLALQRDGSLWVSEKPETRQFSQNQTATLVTYGNDSDWKSIVGRWTSVFALKTNGTLWRIGLDRFDGKTKWPGLGSFTPQQLGTNTDWAGMFILDDRVVIQKSDGRVYVHPAYLAKPVEAITLGEGLVLERSPELERNHWRDLIMISSRRGGAFQIGVAKDGTFRVGGDYVVRNGNLQREEQSIPLSAATNWIALATSMTYRVGDVVALKSDGTMWAWDFPENPRSKPDTAHATRLGCHSDWLAITSDHRGIVSLARDASLWLWRFPGDFELGNFPALLRPSRKPQLIGNIFTETE